MPARRVIGVLIVVLAGALAGRAVAPRPVPQRLVSAGPVTLAVPAGWAPERLAVAFGPPVDRTLVPRALRVRVSAPPRAVRLGGQRAWSYPAPGRQIVVLPTSQGVLGLACAADCAGAVDAVTVNDASILTPAPDLALALQLQPAMAALDAARVRLRTALAGATTPPARSRVATELAREHARAAEWLRPFAGPRGHVLVDQLRASARAYDRLAAEAPADVSAARGDVAAADASLTATVARLRISYAEQAAVRPPGHTERHPGRAALLLIIALGGVLLAGWPGRPRLASRPQPVAPPAGRAMDAPVPAAPAPAWRWDAAPRSGGASPLSALSDPPPP